MDHCPEDYGWMGPLPIEPLSNGTIASVLWDSSPMEPLAMGKLSRWDHYPYDYYPSSNGTVVQWHPCP